MRVDLRGVRLKLAGGGPGGSRGAVLGFGRCPPWGVALEGCEWASLGERVVWGVQSLLLPLVVVTAET